MKILITGAHFTPAVAVIQEFKKMPGIEIVYVGRKTSLEGDKSQSIESKVLPMLGVRFIPIITGRLQRSFTLYTIPSLLKIPVGFIQALYTVFSEKPDVILSFGGYVAVPMVVMGWLVSIPIIIHEQTVVTGLAHKISAFFADKIALSFKTKDFNGHKFVLTGNPLRHEILEGANLFHLRGGIRKIFEVARKEKLPVVLVTGGNQGSHVINQAAEECLDKLIKIACVIHVTGENKFCDFERLEVKQSDRYLVKKWIGSEWGAILSKVDLVICRAGINTLTELAYLGKPAIVIPIPYLYQDEQNKNAKFFERLGLVNILPQSKLSGETLLEKVSLLLDDLNRLKDKAKNAKGVVIPDAAKRLALETILLAKHDEKSKKT